MDIFYIFAALDESDCIHIARLLVLFNVFAGEKGKNSIDGITKLAKLDFLLRYPLYLERALKKRNASLKQIEKIEIKEHEKSSVESKMVRFRYGPWDFRYNRLINQLIAIGLIEIKREGKKIRFFLTDKGFKISNQCIKEINFLDLYKRSQLLKSKLDLTATNLMKFIYKTFPEIGSLKLGEEII